MARSKTASDKALNETDEGNIPDTTPVEEEKPAEEVAEPEAQAEGEVAETEEKVPEEVSEEEAKKGLSQRVRELVKEREEAKAEAKSLAERLAELTGSVEPQVGYQPPFAPQEPIVSPGEELTADELERRLQAREQRILQQADTLAILRTKQQDVVNRINNEANEVVRSYPQLDPESEDFDSELSESVTEAVEKHATLFAGYDQYGKPVYTINLEASVRNLVGKLMKPYQRAVTKEVGKATENLAKQVSEAALRPTSIKPKEKLAEEKTIQELEKELGVVY